MADDEVYKWDQSKFDKTFKDYLAAHEESVLPHAINKKLFYIALAALEETPKKEVTFIQTELAQIITVPHRAGTGDSFGRAPLGYVIASIRASKGWTSSPQFQKSQRKRLQGKSANELAAWRAAVKAKFGKMLGGRKAAAGFLRIGWISVLQWLGPILGGEYSRPISGKGGLHGRYKGHVVEATAGRLSASAENLAHAQSETRGGFMRIGEPALQRAFDRETASMKEYLGEEMEPETQKFNAAQH